MKIIEIQANNYFNMHIFINLHVLIAVFIKSAIQIDTDSKKHQYENSSFLFFSDFQFFKSHFFKVV